MAAAQNNKVKIEKGKKLLKEGNKLSKGGFFSKSNPIDAERKYEDARKLFRFMKPKTPETVSLYLQSLKCLSEIRETMNLPNSAATAMEEGARACSNAVDDKMDKFKEQIPIYHEKAGYYYRLSQQYDLASNHLIKAAKLHPNIEIALNLLNDALEVQEEEKRYITCHPHFDAAVKFCVDNKRYKNALAIMDRQIKMYSKDRDKFGKRIWRNICSKMIIQFHLKQVKIAQSIYLNGMEEFEDCSNYDEHRLCDEFLNVFSSADQEGLEYMQTNSQLGIFFISSIVKIAMKLNMTDIKPIIIIKESLNDNDEQKYDEDNDKEDAKKDIKEEQLKSDMADVEVDDDGAPNLVDM